MNHIGWVAATVLLLLSAARSNADSSLLEPRERPPTPFDRGNFGLSLGIGQMNAFGHTYFGAGAGVGYFVLDGLEVGLFARHEFGDPPSLNELSPSLRYVAQPLADWPVIPYVGVFYNHWFIGDPFDDLDTVGARAGLLRIEGHVVLGLGVLVEHTVSDCTQDCNTVSPDITVGFTF